MKNSLFLIVAFVIASLSLALNDDMIHVHMIPHSHDDYGWIFSVDQYYNDSSPFSGQGAVKDILNSVFREVQKDPNRKFVQVEVGFLNMWWQTKTEIEKQQYKKLIETGQIEIINGGWTMHDEATPYFEDLIENMTVGHLWVKDNLGVIPTVGWQLDPFGHQSTNAALYSQMGFNGQWFARIDYQDFDQRKQKKALEMIWSPQQNSGDENYIFSAVNYQHYSPPKEFYFENGEMITSSNLSSKSEKFVKYFKEMSKVYRSNHLLHTMGEDFAYSRANMWYDSMDQLINYINSRSEQYGMKILYSTPSLYLSEINKQNNQYPINKFDFFPYADQKGAYWTGYFTSRPAVKGFTKDSGRYLQAIRNIFAVENMLQISKSFQQNFKNYIQALENFEQQVAMMMHHDAVTGTERQAVVTDYIKRLNGGYDKIRNHLHPLLSEYTEKQLNENNINYNQCNWNATITQCSITQEQLSNGSTVLIMIHNPSVAKSQLTRIKVPSKSFTLFNSANTQITTDIICPLPDASDCDLYFIDNFEAYSFQYYKITANTINDSIVKPLQQKKSSDFIKVELSDVASLNIQKSTCKFTYQIWKQQKDDYIKSFILSSFNFQLQYNYYTAKDQTGTQVSGAYIFRPNEEKSMPYSSIQQINVYKGKLVTVITLIGTKTTTQLRVQNQQAQSIFEIETFVHSIDVNDSKGKEVVLLINTDIQNDGKFFTDSNGLELQERQVNFRPTWNLEVNEKVSGNYYPIGAMISIQDKNTKQRVSLVNDRSQGGTSLNQGQIEIMIHRRLLKDDQRGVSEALNERDDINGNLGLQQKVRHYLVFENEGEQIARLVQNQLDSAPQIFISKTGSPKFNQVNDQKLFKDSPLLSNKNPYLRVYFRTFQDYYTLRLYNINDINDAEFKLSSNYKILDELTLTANQSKQSWSQNRYKWKSDSGKEFTPTGQPDLQKEIETNTIKIKPLQLRVFKVIQVK